MMIIDKMKSLQQKILFITEAPDGRKIRLFLKDGTDYVCVNIDIENSYWSPSLTVHLERDSDFAFEFDGTEIFYTSNERSLKRTAIKDVRGFGDGKYSESTNIYSIGPKAFGTTSCVQPIMLARLLDTLDEDVKNTLLANAKLAKNAKYQQNILAQL